ncbi:Serine/threonine-protein kinase ksp1 [Hondaea fermentalgiana]|uniref:non-specific serine/threonine protein kinase n=1 Tax=Hondaea fermentalgiana TaxID=2315210 RepID=A0A2R5GV53_9STRA|nr:Serine/threonine-protein kinase ksp1 [Hondaea fermentalgiana]|eukprot:GBG34726.1 Serine/threonine-protein kinase ksp1 [Hondaea fermentalgiana]
MSWAAATGLKDSRPKAKPVKAYGRKNRVGGATGRLRKDTEKWTEALRAGSVDVIENDVQVAAARKNRTSVVGATQGTGKSSHVLASRDVNTEAAHSASSSSTKRKESKKPKARSNAQRQDETFAEPAPPTKPTALVTTSRLGHKARQSVKRTVAKLGPSLAWAADSNDATHVIVSNKDDAPAGLTVLLALARGAYIVGESWLDACKSGQTIASPEGHEAEQQCPGASKLRIAKAEAKLEKCLLAGLSCFCEDRCGTSNDKDCESNVVADSKLSLLVKACNGTIASTRAKADLCICADETIDDDLWDASGVLQCSRAWLAERLRHGDLVRDHLGDLREKQNERWRSRLRTRTFASDSILENVLSYLSESQLLGDTVAVSKRWARASRVCAMRTSVRAVRRMCELLDSNDEILDLVGRADRKKRNELPIWQCAAGLARNFPRGKFLSQGSYKKVFKVWCASAQREEALSVMEYGSILRNASVAVVAQEVDVAVQVSELVSRGICANFIETYQVFQTETPPLETIWGSSASRDDATDDVKSVASLESESEGRYCIFQYIRMELCAHGDCEEYLKTCPDALLAVDATLGLFSQMVFALLIGHRELGLRHYDIKLLNYFISDGATDSTSYCMRVNDGLTLEDASSGLVAKLADYGTAYTGPSAAQSLCVDHFTTLENAPPEFMMLGDAASPECADAFALGLCMLHLFTGACPYEEMMASVRCPIGVKRVLKRIWANSPAVEETESESGETSSKVSRSTSRTHEESEEEAEKETKKMDEKDNETNTRASWSILQQVCCDDPEDTLHDTLYRYVVLLGLPEQDSTLGSSEVGQALHSLLAPKGSKRTTKAMEQFELDRAQFALESGEHPLIARAASRLASVPGSMKLLQGLMAWNPEDRFSDYEQVLKHEALERLELQVK